MGKEETQMTRGKKMLALLLVLVVLSGVTLAVIKFTPDETEAGRRT